MFFFFKMEQDVIYSRHQEDAMITKPSSLQFLSLHDIDITWLKKYLDTHYMWWHIHENWGIYHSKQDNEKLQRVMQTVQCNKKAKTNDYMLKLSLNKNFMAFEVLEAWEISLNLVYFPNSHNSQLGSLHSWR